jgi:hypothetical protein
MRNKLLLGFKRYMIPVPHVIWQIPISRNTQEMEAELGFMSEEHHLVRNYVVRELPRIGEPLSPEHIADRLNLPVARVSVILDDLEKHMTFLFRDRQRAVDWAYPVTVEHTPHHVTYNTGEQGYAA